MELKGDPSGRIQGTVIESKISRGQGPLATVIVQRGTLKPGCILVAGNTWCKVKSMVNAQGRSMSLALPSTPVEISGWKDVPEAGTMALQTDSEIFAKKVVQSRLFRQQIAAQMESIEGMNLKRVKDRTEDTAPEETTGPTLFKMILKTDVNGSREAILESLAGLPSHEVKADVIYSGVGPLNESDLDLAVSSGGILVSKKRD